MRSVPFVEMDMFRLCSEIYNKNIRCKTSAGDIL